VFYRLQLKRLQLCVRAVAKRVVLRMLAATPRHRSGLGNVQFLQREIRAFVRAVAKCLFGSPPASAPSMRAGLELLYEGELLSDDRIRYDSVGLSRWKPPDYGIKATGKCRPQDYSRFFGSDERGSASLSRVSHQTTMAGPKQRVTPIGIVQILQNLSIRVVGGCRAGKRCKANSRSGGGAIELSGGMRDPGNEIHTGRLSVARVLIRENSRS
jgi:hypothetical protein